MRRFLRNKFTKSASKETADQSSKDRGNSLSTKSNVNEEYSKAFRSNSYEEIWNKGHGHLGTATTSNVMSSIGVSSSSESSPPFYLHLSEHLLEPRQEILMSMVESLNFHRLLIEYFEASLRACNVCGLLLRSIDQARSDYRKIKRVIKISKRVGLVDHDLDDNNRYCRAMFGEVKAISLLRNPLSIITPSQFRDIREDYMVLLHKLTLKGKKIKRRDRLSKMFKRVRGFGPVIALNVLLIALLIFKFHGVFGITAGPNLAVCSSVNYLRKKKKKKAADLAAEGRISRALCEPFNVAAKGMFILINDFDTMCQMVRRLQDEIEHRKSLAEICAMNYGRFEVLREEVVKELSDQEASFLDQLEELEGHIYLCLVTINRSRRLVIQEIIANCS